MSRCNVQQGVQPTAPIQERPPRRPNRGQFKPANTKSLAHGGYSKRASEALLPGQEGLRAALQERLSELVSDQGGADACGLVRRDALATYQRLWCLEETLWADIERKGALTAKGRARAAMAAFLRVVDRRVKLGAELGVERRPKPTRSLADYLHEVAGTSTGDAGATIDDDGMGQEPPASIVSQKDGEP